MGSSKAANAVLAKVRAKYGRHLTEKDYNSLLASKSVSEVVSYLKNNTYYSDALNKVNERDIHRGQLEDILRHKIFNDFYSLCLYTRGSGEYFAQFIVERSEIEIIIHFLTLLSSQSLDDHIFNLPSYFSNHTSIDFLAVSRAQNYTQFCDALEGSPYKKILSKFKPGSDQRIDIASIENQLYLHCYDNLYSAINKSSSGQERRALLQMFNSIMDYINFVRIFRLKKYYKMDSEKTKKYIFPYGTLNKKTIAKLCDAENSADVFGAVSTTSFGKRLKKLNYVYAGEIDNLGLYTITKRNIHFSSFPLVVMLSYVFVMETEYQNIVSIIEGVRYNVDPAKIKSIVIT